MIKYNKDVISKEMYNLVKKAQHDSINYMKHFFSLLDLNPELFNHLYNINLFIDYERYYLTDDKIAAFYNTRTNEIHIYKSFIELLLNNDEKFDRDRIISILSFTLTHEYMHANRDLYSNDSINSMKLLLFNHDYNYENLYSNYGHLIKMTRNIEELSIKQYIDHNEVIAYDHSNKCFKLFTYPKDKKFNKKEIHRIINSYSLQKENNFIYRIAFYNYNDNDDIVYNNYYNAPSFAYNPTKSLKNMSSIERGTQEKTIRKQCNMEEVLIDSLAFIILNSKNRDSLDLNATYQYFIDHNNNPLLNVGLYLFNELGVDGIKWFTLSCYMEEYRDKIKEIYAKKYSQILTKFSGIYKAEYNGQEISENRVDTTKRLLRIKK